VFSPQIQKCVLNTLLHAIIVCVILYRHTLCVWLLETFKAVHSFRQQRETIISPQPSIFTAETPRDYPQT